MRNWILIFCCLIKISPVWADEFYPSNILLMDQKFSHHIALVEKSTHSLYLYQSDNGFPVLLKRYQIATGKYSGNKSTEGDKRTPEGIYLLEKFLADTDLNAMYGETQAKIYGAGAFTSNYPNIIDQRNGKTGSGIWLHSTDDNTRISKGLDSKGCVVVVDEDLKDISKYIDLKNTSMVIVQNLSFLNKSSYETIRSKIITAVEDWKDAWSNKDFERYISHYHKEAFNDPSKGDYRAYKAYKKAVFARDDKPIIQFSHTSVLLHEKYAVVQMEQNYKSPIIDDVGKKVLYLQRDENYNWKIAAEQWSRLDQEQRNIAFVPSMRFFKN